MAFRARIKAVVALTFAAASVCAVASCGQDVGAQGSAKLPPQDKQIVEATLTNGTSLDCAQWMTRNSVPLSDNTYVLDCDWDHPRTSHNPDLQLAGTFQVAQTHFKDGRTLNCLNFDSDGNTVLDCDWNHPLKTN